MSLQQDNQSKGIKGLTDSTMRKIKEMVDSNTIIGEAIHGPKGTVIIPVSRVNIGFASGGLELDEKGNTQIKSGRLGGGSGGGLKIEPVAFLVISDTGVQLLQVADRNQTLDRALNLLPGLIEQLAKKLEPKDKKEVLGDDFKQVDEVVLDFIPETD